MVKHICVDCEKEFDGPDIPKEIAEIEGSLMCPNCTKAEGLPTAKDLGIGEEDEKGMCFAGNLDPPCSECPSRDKCGIDNPNPKQKE